MLRSLWETIFSVTKFRNLTFNGVSIIYYLMPEQKTDSDNYNAVHAETARLRYAYRKLLVSGRARIPLRDAALLIGPDCAYHLYSGLKKKEK